MIYTRNNNGLENDYDGKLPNSSFDWPLNYQQINKKKNKT